MKRDALQVSFVANKNFAKDHASWRNPTLKSQINLAAVAPIDGAESAISSRVALACEKACSRGASECGVGCVSKNERVRCVEKVLSFVAGLLQ